MDLRKGDFGRIRTRDPPASNPSYMHWATVMLGNDLKYATLK